MQEYSYTHLLETQFFVWRNSDFTTLNPLFNKQCLFFSLLIHTQRLLKPTDLTELCLPKPRDRPKTENRFVQLQPSTHCLLIHLFTYPNFYSNSLIFQNKVTKPRDMNKTRKRIVHLQLSTNFTTLNPLFIYITVHLRQTFTQSY